MKSGGQGRLIFSPGSAISGLFIAPSLSHHLVCVSPMLGTGKLKSFRMFNQEGLFLDTHRMSQN